MSNLSNSNTSQIVLTTLTEIAAIDATPFTSFLADLQAAIDRQPALLTMAVKIFGAVGRLSQVGSIVLAISEKNNHQEQDRHYRPFQNMTFRKFPKFIITLSDRFQQKTALF